MERLDKLLASQGTRSRSQIRQLIRSGAVTVNGQTVKKADLQIEPEKDRVTLKGNPMAIEQHVYFMLHKPAGVVSATRDSRERTVLDLLPPELQRKGLFPAGRPDKDTEGFLLITDDGELAHRLLSPKRHVTKTYEAIIDSPVTQEDIDAFAEGIRIGQDLCRSAGLQVLEQGPNPKVEILLTEGLYHQIKRMFQARGKKVLYLKRTKMGPVCLDPSLKKGEARALTDQEKKLLGI